MEIGTVDDDLKKTCHGMDASVKSENSIENPCETFPSMGAALNAESKDENALAILTNDNTVKLDNQTLERGECTHDAKKTNFNNPNCEAQINVSQSNDEMVVDNIPSSTEEVFNTENNLQKFDSVSKTVLTDLVNSVVDMVKHNSTNPQEANTNLNDNVAVQQLQPIVNREVNREDENIPTSNLSSSSQKNVLFTLNQFSDSSDSPRHSRRKRIPKKLDDEETKKTPPNPVPFVKEKLPVIETPILYKIADLVWSYVPGHPLWPCMLTNDPLEEITTKMQGGGQKPCRAYHVQFLGDSPEHGWVRETRVFPYNERSDYERIIKELALKNKRQPTKIPRLEIPSRLKEDWEAGIVEIAEAVSFTAEERIAKFEYDFRPFMKKLKNKPLDGDNADGSGKAKVSHAKQKKNLKRLNNEARTKSDNLHQIKRGRKPGIKVKSGTLKLGVQGAKLKGSIGNTELLRFSNDHQIKDKDATDDKQTVETLIESPQKTDNMDLFNCYCEKRKGPLVTENPRLTPEQVEALIFMEWESLTPEKQQKYGRKRIVEAAKSPTTSSISITSPKRKRGRPFKHPQPTEAVASHGAEIGSPKQFSCSACNTSYASKTSLGQHKRWCLAENKSKDLSNKVLLKSPNNIGNVSDETWECTFTCSGCQDKFFSAKSLQIHNKFCSESDTQAGSPSANTKRLSKQTSHGSWAKTNSKRASMANGSLLENAELLANSNLISLNANKSSKHPKSGSGMATNGRKQSNQDDSSSNGSKGDSEWPPRKIRSRGPQLGSMAKRENICIKCEANGEDLLACNGGCCQSIHPACIDGETPKGDEPYKCSSCINNTHPCFICKEGPKPSDTGLGEIKRCTVQNCGRSYHATCLHLRKVAIMAAVVDNDQGNGDRHSLINSSRCTLHHCATCASKLSDNHNTSANVAGCRMFKCVRCPTAYHAGDDCIAAGSIVLPGLNIICPEHFEPLKTTPYHQPVHISWCFICSKGGQLLCCDSCPAAFHPKCVDMEDPPEGEWFCRDCRYRRRPLYGDIVWVKLGSYRWWPGEITHPNDIPDNIQNLRHGVGEFVVNFFGSNDYFWLNKRRVFAYQEGDTGASSVHCSRGISSVFNKALRVAADKFEEMTTQRQKIQDVKTLKKRPQYKFIKTNKPVGNVQMQTADVSEIPRCHCKRTDPNPCGAESECINRMLMFECHATLCPAGEKCQNQHFQKRDYPESEVFKTSWGGWGLRVKTAVKKGQFVSEYVGELVDGEECLRRIELAHKNNVTNFYMLTIDKDRIIDAGPKGNFSRFMNHCCDPSCETQKWTINGDTRVGLFARRDILAGEELTFNYNLDCLGNDKTPCMCGSKNCSGFIGVRPKPQLVDGHHLSQKAKRKRKRTEQREIPKHDDFCFRCRQVGTLVCCDVRGCQRAFCLSCLRLTKPPFGKWECPWHHCDFCGRRAQSFCHFCPNSFCASHISNQLVQSLPNGYDCCTDHNPEVAEYEMEEAIAAVVASMIPQENWDDSLEIKDVDEPVPQEVRRPVKPRVSSLKEETPHKTNQTATTSAPRKRGRPRKVVDPIVKSEASNNIEMFKALSPPSTSKCPSHSDEVITESDSDEELGRPTSSPVRRKRAKRQYFKGRKKRRRSKVLPPSQLDHAANEDEGKSPVADLVVVKEPEASELMKDATDSPANSTEH